MMMIAGDIGGTKTNLAIYGPDSDPRQPMVEASFQSDEYDSLSEILVEFIGRINLPVQTACFGIAGPVVEGRVQATNLPWLIDERQLREDLNFSSVCLINDLESIATAVPILEESDLVTLNPGEVELEGAIAVIAPGTGLGEAYLTWDGLAYRAHPSEGGHTDFGPTNDLQIELLRFLNKRMEHVSYERICSGIGIPNIYDFLKETGFAEEPSWLMEMLLETDDPTPVIARAASDTENPCPLCAATMDLFVTILASEVGNMALKVLATGGIYLGGGIPPKILPRLADGGFLSAFQNKGRFNNLLSKMPIHVIMNDKAGLYGAAFFGLSRMSGT
jgi:glucokinase